MKKFDLVVFIMVFMAWSCEEIILEDNISNEVVQILAPSNNSVLNITDVQFSWEAIQFSDGYQLQVAEPNFQFATQILEDTLVGSTSFRKTLSSGPYEWRVRAVNSAYETNYTTQAFSIEE